MLAALSGIDRIDLLLAVYTGIPIVPAVYRDIVTDKSSVLVLRSAEFGTTGKL